MREPTLTLPSPRQHKMKQLTKWLLMAPILFLLGVPTHGETAAKAPDVQSLLFHGPTPTVDAAFLYYQGRTADSIAEEIALRGYKTVHMVVTSERNVNGQLLDALHDHGIAVWAMVWAGGTYSTAGFPAEWPEWRQQLITPAAPDGFIYLSPYHPGYREWKKKAVAQLIQDYPFDGIELVEAFFPNWNGLQSGVYGDIGPYAQAAFRERFGEEPPDFVDRSSPRYYTKVPALYEKWVQFRVDTVTEWLDELVNGEGGIRQARPGIPVATWTLATDWPRSMEKARYDLGEDLAAVLKAVKPDIHILQTNWPDWIKGELPADYIRSYQPYIDVIRSVAPDMPIGIQADIGSQIQNRRDWDWIAQFEEVAWDMGFSTTTMYEYHIAMYMYTEPPRIEQVSWIDDTTIRLSFNKRIDWTSARNLSQFQVMTDESGEEPHPELTASALRYDGNRIHVTISGPEKALAAGFYLKVEGVRDLPLVRLLKDFPALTMEPQLVSVPSRVGESG